MRNNTRMEERERERESGGGCRRARFHFREPEIIGGIEGSEPAHYPKPLLSVAAREDAEGNGGEIGRGEGKKNEGRGSARKKEGAGHHQRAVAVPERSLIIRWEWRERSPSWASFSLGEFVIRRDIAPKARDGEKRRCWRRKNEGRKKRKNS